MSAPSSPSAGGVSHETSVRIANELLAKREPVLSSVLCWGWLLKQVRGPGARAWGRHVEGWRARGWREEATWAQNALLRGRAPFRARYGPARASPHPRSALPPFPPTPRRARAA